MHYGIKVGQHYVPADGADGLLIVRDVETYADCDDVVVFDTKTGEERRIDAFKLAMVRYSLVSTDETRTEMPEFAIWWLDQSAHELATALGAPRADWPEYIKDQFESREGRAGRGRLWISPEINFGGIGIDWKDGDPVFAAVGRDCGGIVIRKSDAHHVSSWPGFVTDENLRLITYPEIVDHCIPTSDRNQVSDDARDAARWRALVGCARLRIMGSAGFAYGDKPSSPDGYRHIGIEAWSLHNAPSSQSCIALLTDFADHVIAMKKEITDV